MPGPEETPRHSTTPGSTRWSTWDLNGGNTSTSAPSDSPPETSCKTTHRGLPAADSPTQAARRPAAAEEDDRERYTHLSRRAEKEHGRCHELALCFVAGGIVHKWTAYASWWDQLTDELDELKEKYLPDKEVQPEDPPSTPEEIERLAGLLEALPDFREATKRQERERITLRAFPELRSHRYNGLSRLGYDALSEATERTAETSKKIYAEFTANLTSLAQEILDAGVLPQATTAAVRRAAIRTFMQERSGGYPPNKDFVELLYGEPLLQKPTKASRTTAPALWHET